MSRAVSQVSVLLPANCGVIDVPADDLAVRKRYECMKGFRHCQVLLDLHPIVFVHLQGL